MLRSQLLWYVQQTVNVENAQKKQIIYSLHWSIYKGGGGFYRGQFRVAATCRCSFREVLKVSRDALSLTVIGRAFHIDVA